MVVSRNYVGWYKLKAELERQAVTRQFQRREIWWCALGVNISDEEDGKNEYFERPVLVLRKYSKSLFLGLPMTSSRKQSKFYFPVDIDGIDRSVMLSQGRTLSSYRLLRRIYRLNDNTFASIERAYIDLTVEKTISAEKSAESPVPNGSLYTNDSKHEQKSQVKGGG